MRRSAAVALCSLLVAGCSSMPQLVSNDDLEARDRRILELEREVSRARAEAATLRARVAELERTVAASTPPPLAPPAAAGEPVATDEPPESIGVAPAAAPRFAIEESDLAEPQGTGAAPGDAARYEAALAALNAGRLDEAERELLSFAESARESDLADNAWFWLGESRAARGDLPAAIDAYRTAIDRYPEGNKVPDALLKLGVALDATGQREPAREVWSELVRRFPTTAAADAASLRLEAP